MLQAFSAVRLVRLAFVTGSIALLVACSDDAGPVPASAPPGASTPPSTASIPAAAGVAQPVPTGTTSATTRSGTALRPLSDVRVVSARALTSEEIARHRAELERLLPPRSIRPRSGAGTAVGADVSGYGTAIVVERTADGSIATRCVTSAQEGLDFLAPRQPAPAATE